MSALLCLLSASTLVAADMEEELAMELTKKRTAYNAAQKKAKKKRLSEDEFLAKVSAKGRYDTLLKIFNIPGDKKKYGIYADEGYDKAQTYKGHKAPAGHWVYVYPDWYLWKNEDLAKVGFEAITRKIKLKQKTITVIFKHHKDNREWAKRVFDAYEATMPELEEMSGRPYRAYDPYIIYEDPSLKLLGSSGPSGMALGNPEGACEWTMIHEAIHIFNAGRGPDYICEGLANYISYRLMLKHRIPFEKGWGVPDYIKEWREQKGTRKDVPMNDPKDQYYSTKQGKAMEFWQLVYEQLGYDFIIKCFARGCRGGNFGNAEMIAMMKKHGFDKAEDLLKGWVTRGDYVYKASKSMGEAGTKEYYRKMKSE